MSSLLDEDFWGTYGGEEDSPCLKEGNIMRTANRTPRRKLAVIFGAATLVASGLVFAPPATEAEAATGITCTGVTYNGNASGSFRCTNPTSAVIQVRARVQCWNAVGVPFVVGTTYTPWVSVAAGNSTTTTFQANAQGYCQGWNTYFRLDPESRFA